MKNKNKTYYHSEVNIVSVEETTIDISTVLDRQAENITVINDGPDKMFVKVYGSNNQPSKEVWIYPKHRRILHKVSKLLIGKTNIGNSYRVSEFDVILDGYYCEKCMFRSKSLFESLIHNIKHFNRVKKR